MKISPSVLWTVGFVAVLFIIAVGFRPLLPIDETRYMTVAWEMHLRQGWLAPLTLNFEPYTHKPPLLFWLINLSWHLFGIGRAAGLLPIVIAAGCFVLLTVQLCRSLTVGPKFDASRITLITLGSIPFLLYSTLMLFDLTLAVFVLSALLCLVQFSKKRAFRYIVLMALATGLGLLTKGPVAILYIVFPVLLAPWWVRDFSQAKQWYCAMIVWLGLSLVIPLIWLVPVLEQSSHEDAFWLLWNQTAGRVAGNFKDAHIRPFYFYLPLLPVLFAPWIFFPKFWHGLKSVNLHQDGIRFCLCWFLPTFVIFSLISGKQPHYLIPLLPAIIIFLCVVLKTICYEDLRDTCVGLLMLFIVSHTVLNITIFRAYDLDPIAKYVAEHSDHDWSFVRNYHGEIGYLGRLTIPITNLDDLKNMDAWFAEHPDGLAIIRYDDEIKVSKYQKILSKKHRGKFIGIFAETENRD